LATVKRVGVSPPSGSTTSLQSNVGVLSLVVAPSGGDNKVGVPGGRLYVTIALMAPTRTVLVLVAVLRTPISRVVAPDFTVSLTSMVWVRAVQPLVDVVARLTPESVSVPSRRLKV
jgi:hypothetical protein